MASQITGVSIDCSPVRSGSDQGKHQSSASLAVVRGIHQRPLDSPHKGPVTQKMFPFDDIIMVLNRWPSLLTCMYIYIYIYIYIYHNSYVYQKHVFISIIFTDLIDFNNFHTHLVRFKTKLLICISTFTNGILAVSLFIESECFMS